MIGLFSAAIRKASKNAFKDDYVEQASRKLEEIVLDFEGSKAPTTEQLFDFEDYVEYTSQLAIKDEFDDPDIIEQYYDMQKVLDPTRTYSNDIFTALSDAEFAYKQGNLKNIKTPFNTLPEHVRPLAGVSGELTARGILQDKAASIINDETIKSMGASALKKLLENKEYEDIINFIARKLPENQAIEEINVSAAQRAQNMEDFTRNSFEKTPQYRTITSYQDLPYDLSFVAPRELGVHVGTLGQATGIAIKSINPYSDIGRYLDYKLTPMRPEDSQEFFKTQKFIEQKYKGPSLKEIQGSKPAMMSKGFIDVRNPLRLEFDSKNWSAHSFIPEFGREIYQAIIEQSTTPIPAIGDEIMKLYQRAEEISLEPNIYLDSDDYERALARQLDIIKLNFDFQKLLQKNGFDSVRYKNEVEASLVGEPKYSYILFRPEQFKSTTAKTFSKEDPRFAYNEGGPVERKGGLIPSNIKALVSDLLGLHSPITEEFLSEEEYQSLIGIARRAKEAGKDIIEYADYQTESEGQSQYADVGGGGGNLDFFRKIFDPDYSLKTTLGQARIEEDENGNTLIIDRYNFNDAGQDKKFLDFIAGIKNAGSSVYPQIRNIGRHYGSGPGEGSEVVINLGQLTPREKKTAFNMIEYALSKAKS